MNRLDYQETIYNPIINNNSKGFLNSKLLKNYKESYTIGVIRPGMEYRPDLVAKYYLGDVSRAWEIEFINNFTNGVKDFKLGRNIKIPN